MFKRKTPLQALAALLVLAVLFTGCGRFGAGAKVDKQLELAVKYLSENKFEEAVLAYNEVLKIDSNNLPAYKGLGRAYALQGKYGEAEKTLQDGLSQVEDKNQLRLSLAGLYVDQGKNDLAEKAYADLIAADKSLLPAYEGLAQVLMAQGRVDEAVQLAGQCIESNSASEQSYNLLAGAYLYKGDQNQALSLLSQSLRINPSQQAAYLLLEQLYSKDWAKIAEFGSTLLASDEAAGRTLKIYAFYKASQYSKAVEEYLAFQEKSLRADKARVLAAICYIKTGDSKAANGLISEVKLKDSKSPFLYADAARYYLEAGDYQQARKIALEGISLDDTSVENYLVLVDVAKKENQGDQALYYSYLLLTRSTEPAVNVQKDLQGRGIEVKFPGVKEQVLSQRPSLEEIKKYLPAKEYKIGQSLWVDIDNDSVEELAIITRNFDRPNYSIPDEDARYMVFKKTGGNVKTLVSGIMPASGYSDDISVLKINGRTFIVIKDWYGADGVPVAIALTMNNGTLQPVWIGSGFEDVEGDGVMEGIYYELYGGALKEKVIYEWNEAQLSFINSRGDKTTGYSLDRLRILSELRSERYNSEQGVSILRNFASLIATRKYLEASYYFSYEMMSSPYVNYQPVEYLERMFGNSERSDIKLEVAEINNEGRWISAGITRKNGGIPFFAGYKNGEWRLVFGDEGMID